MGLFARLRALVAAPGGRAVAGGTAVGLGVVAAATARQLAQGDPEPATSAVSATAIEVEGRAILVPVTDAELLDDGFDSELDGAGVEDTTMDTPVSPEPAPSPSTPADASGSPGSPGSAGECRVAVSGIRFRASPDRTSLDGDSVVGLPRRGL